MQRGHSGDSSSEAGFSTDMASRAKGGRVETRRRASLRSRWVGMALLVCSGAGATKQGEILVRWIRS